MTLMISQAFVIFQGRNSFAVESCAERSCSSLCPDVDNGTSSTSGLFRKELLKVLKWTFHELCVNYIKEDVSTACCKFKDARIDHA